MARKKSAAELRAENRMLRRYGVGRNATRIVLTTIRYGVTGLVFIYFFYTLSSIADSWAGKTTEANVSVNVDAVADADVGLLERGVPLKHVVPIVLISLLSGMAGVAYGRYQDSLRKRTVARLSKYATWYEESHDPNRKSSRSSGISALRHDEEGE